MVDSDSQQQTLRERQKDTRFEEFDEPGFQEKFAQSPQPGRSAITLAIEGIHCAACVWLIEKLPTMVPGIVLANVNWSQGTVLIHWQTGQVQLSSVANALYRLGYTPHPLRTNERMARRKAENHRQLTRIGFAAAAAGNNMLVAAALYLGMFSYMATDMESFLRVVSCVVGLASFLGPGRVFLQGATNALRTRTPHMDLPIALGLTAGSVAGVINTIRGVGEIYFDSLSVLICLLLIGRWIQFRQQNKAADSVELLYRLTPDRARKLVNGEVVEIRVEDLKLDDIIQVNPGEMIAADGVLIEGESEIDESILTGESRPCKKSPGENVSAGTQNLGSRIRVQVTNVGPQTRISKIIALVEQAGADKPEIVQWANRIGAHFVVVVIGLAFVTFAVWMFIDPAVALDRSIALLIVACPCALAMATPLAISVALGRLAKRKILVKAGDVLQSLSQPGMIWLDKTGTLTEGRMEVVEGFDWSHDIAVGLPRSGFSSNNVIAINDWSSHMPDWVGDVVDAEAQFQHPVADAFMNLFSTFRSSDQSIPTCDSTVQQATQLDGGISATIGDRGLLIGSRRLLERNDVPLNAVMERMEADLLQRQLSPCWVAINGQVVGLVGLGDRIRRGSKQMVQQLQDTGWQVGVLSGDHPSVVNSVAEQLSIAQYHAGVSPEEKLKIIQDSNEQFPTTVMVGDGVNDSAALAAATVGIAVQNGAEASLAAAPVYLGRHGLNPIGELLQISNAASRGIRRNFAVSLGYNVLGASLAMIGWINPLTAAILMPISSLTVIGLSLSIARDRSR